MTRDAGTKADTGTELEGHGPPSKEQVDTQDAAEAVGQQQGGQTPSADPGRAGAEAQQAAEEQPKERAPSQAEGTAAATTGVDKVAAEAAVTEGSTEVRAAPEAPAAAPRPRPQRRERREAGERVVVRAQAKYVRTSARKARLLADHVRGKSVADARAILAFSPRSIAEDWRKVLESAVANAEHNHDLVGDDLVVLNAIADEGPTLKRFRPRAMGRATRIRKRTSHLTITLTPRA